MADDLKRLAKGAGRQPDAEAEALLAELLGYRQWLRRTGRVEGVPPGAGATVHTRRVRTRAAAADPARSAGVEHRPDRGWLDLLEATGALADLRSGNAGGSPRGCTRFLDYRQHGWYLMKVPAVAGPAHRTG
jgi:hypothetical protein